MSETSKFERFAWVAKYIVAVRPGEKTLEFEFPPHTVGAKEAIEEMMAMKLPHFEINRKTTWYCTFPNEEFFRFLWGEQIRVGPYFADSSNVQPTPQTSYSLGVKFNAEFLASIKCGDDLYMDCLSSLEDEALMHQMEREINVENYELAAMIRDEITKRARSPYGECFGTFKL